MKIGIFTAMQKEAQPFLSNVNYEKSSIGRYDIYKFVLNGNEVVQICPPNIGEIGASSAVQILISVFNVDVVINFGVVGGLTEQASLFSTVLVESVVHYDMDTSSIDPVEPARYTAFDDVAVKADEKLLALAQSISNYPLVRCASADKFVTDVDIKKHLSGDFGASICDMESAGILFTCKFNNIPCLLVKCVSDSLFGNENDYASNAVKACEGFFEFVSKLIGKLQ